MSDDTSTPGCARFDRSMEPYIDGELDASHALDIEAHVVGCDRCAERVAHARAMRNSLKRVTACKAPDALRAHISATLADEQYREHVSERDTDDEHETPKLIGFKYVAALAAAAGVVFALSVARHGPPDTDRSGSHALTSSAAAQTVELDGLLDELVSLHAHPLPPETTDPNELKRFDPLVGVPVRRPQFKPFGGSFNGARVHAMNDRRAVLLQYTMTGGHRVTVYVFDPRVLPVRGTRLTERLVRERPVYVGTMRGYSVAAAEQSGVGYALASDLDDDQSTQLVLAAFQQ